MSAAEATMASDLNYGFAGGGLHQQSQSVHHHPAHPGLDSFMGSSNIIGSPSRAGLILASNTTASKMASNGNGCRRFVGGSGTVDRKLNDAVIIMWF